MAIAARPSLGRTARRRRLVHGLALWIAAGVLACSSDDGARQGGEPATDDARVQRSRLAADLTPERFNVVLVTVDTLRADRISSYGSTFVETPHFDRIASEGIRFANASTTVPFTLPAHSSIMTGTYPPYHAVRENVGYYLDPADPTLAERLEAEGWDTAGFVSAFVLDRRWGIARGFDHYHDDFDLGELAGRASAPCSATAATPSTRRSTGCASGVQPRRRTPSFSGSISSTRTTRTSRRSRLPRATRAGRMKARSPTPTPWSASSPSPASSSVPSWC